MSHASMYKTCILWSWQHIKQSREVPWLLSEDGKLSETEAEGEQGKSFRLDVDVKFPDCKELIPELDFSLVASKEIDRENLAPFDSSKWFTTRLVLAISFVLSSSWDKISNSWDPIPESWLEIEALLSNLGLSPGAGAPSVSVSDSIRLRTGFKDLADAGRVFLLNLGLSGTHPFLMFQHFAQYRIYGLLGVLQL